jgi:hypothetical protein
LVVELGGEVGGGEVNAEAGVVVGEITHQPGRLVVLPRGRARPGRGAQGCS